MQRYADAESVSVVNAHTNECLKSFFFCKPGLVCLISELCILEMFQHVGASTSCLPLPISRNLSEQKQCLFILTSRMPIFIR